MNTALGNCLIMCAMVWTFAREQGVRIKLANNGDDCVVFMERVDLQRFMRGLGDWFYGLGFRMTIEQPVYEFNQVEFCEMKPIETVNGWTMVRNIEKALEKDSISIIPLDSKAVAQKWMYAVGECGLALCSGVPIMQALYKFYMRSGLPSKIAGNPALMTGMRFLTVGLTAKEREVTAESRDHVFAAWGITPDEQESLESYYDSLEMSFSEAWDNDELNLFQSAPF